MIELFIEGKTYRHGVADGKTYNTGRNFASGQHSKESSEECHQVTNELQSDGQPSMENRN